MRSVLALLVGLVVFPGGSAQADVASANMHVSAQVLPHARFDDLAAPVPVVVTAADVERGFVDVSRQYRVRTNAPERVLIQVHPRVGLTQAIDIDGFAAPLRLEDTSLEVSQLPARDFTLSFRLWLGPGAAPGEYPLPVHLAAAVR